MIDTRKGVTKGNIAGREGGETEIKQRKEQDGNKERQAFRGELVRITALRLCKLPECRGQALYDDVAAVGLPSLVGA